MTRSRRLAAVAVVALVPLGQGCITMIARTETVRPGETRTPVTFETEAAGQAFHAALQRCPAEQGGTFVGVPFITLYAKQQKLSDAARWNDAVGRCDTNADGVVTLAEAQAFAKSVGAE